jgi:hypothetical protein
MAISGGVFLHRWIFFLGLFLITVVSIEAENITLYAGTTSSKARYVGVSLGDDIFPYLQCQIDVLKFTKKDSSLFSDIPEENRSDFLGASLNFALRIPIYLIPHLDRLRFIAPYVLAGYGAGLENLSTAYFDVPNADGKTGFVTKLRQYHSYGGGLIVMLTSRFGVKFDYRSMNMPGLVKMGYPSRKLNRFSFGICIGSTD